MKISINCKKIEGSYGGVVTFYKLLEQYLLKNGHSVVNHLGDDDIDIILITAGHLVGRCKDSQESGNKDGLNSTCTAKDIVGV